MGGEKIIALVKMKKNANEKIQNGAKTASAQAGYVDNL